MPLFSHKILYICLLVLVGTYQFAVYTSDTTLAQTRTDPANLPEQEQLKIKLQAYVECYNQLDQRAHTVADSFYWVTDKKIGPTGNEKSVGSGSKLDAGNIGSCTKSIADVQKVNPQLALDVAATDYIKAIEEMNLIAVEMYPYFDRQNYKDDGFAKAKQWYPKFIELAEFFKAASKRFSKELNQENDKHLEMQMAQLEKAEGRKLPYLNISTMHRAKLLMRLLAEETFPADQGIAQMDAFEKAADEELQFAKDNRVGLSIMWDNFVRHVEEFRKKAKERVRRVRDNVPYSDAEAKLLRMGYVGGSPLNVIRSYNALVDASNKLH